MRICDQRSQGVAHSSGSRCLLLALLVPGTGKVVLSLPASGEHRGAWHDPGRQGNEVQVQVGWRPLSCMFQVCMGSQP